MVEYTASSHHTKVPSGSKSSLLTHLPDKGFRQGPRGCSLKLPLLCCCFIIMHYSLPHTLGGMGFTRMTNIASLLPATQASLTSGWLGKSSCFTKEQETAISLITHKEGSSEVGRAGLQFEEPCGINSITLRVSTQVGTTKMSVVIMPSTPALMNSVLRKERGTFMSG